jgi:charged multivesicular body protein 1
MLLAKQAIAAQMDQAADMAELSLAQIQANNALNRMTAMMQQSSRTMARAQRASANPERTLLALEQFRAQNEEYAVNTGIYQDAVTQSASVQVSDDAVHELLGKLADDAGLELGEELRQATTSKEDPVKEAEAPVVAPEVEDALTQRLRALRE